MTTAPHDVLDHIRSAIGAASAAQAAAARQRLVDRFGRDHDLGALGLVAERLCAARHSPHPAVADKVVVVCAADHGVADPGVDLGDSNPTLVALRHLASGRAAVNAAARTAGARVVLVDCGVRGAESYPPGEGVIDLRLGDGSADFTQGPAMTEVSAVMAVQTGIALLFSLADQGLDVLAVGQLGWGSQPVSAAVVAAVTEMANAELDPADADAVSAALAANPVDTDDPIAILTRLGGFDLGVLTGLILGAASINLPVVLDDHATSAAALLACRLEPSVAGYLIGSHAGTSPSHRRALHELGVTVIFDLGLAHGEGTGAALTLPLIDSAAALIAELP